MYFLVLKVYHFRKNPAMVLINELLIYTVDLLLLFNVF